MPPVLLQLLKSKPVKIIAIIIILAGISVRISAQIMGVDKYSAFIISEITNLTEKKVTIEGEISLKTVPILNTAKLVIPTITITELNEKNSSTFLKANKITINMSLLDFLFGKFSFKSIEIDDYNVNLVSSNNETPNNWSFIYDALAKKNEFAKINHIKFYNGKISVVNKNNIFVYDQANLDINIDKIKTDIIGNFFFNELAFNIESSIESLVENDQQAISIKLIHDGTNLLLNGKLTRNDHLIKIEGETHIHLTKPSFITRYLVKAIPAMSSSPREILKDEMDVTGRLSLERSYFRMDDLKISSKTTNGSGNIEFFLTDNLDLSLSLNFEQIDLSNFIVFDGGSAMKVFSDKILEQNNSSNATDSNSYLNFNLIDSHNIFIDFMAKKMLASDTEFQNIDFTFNTKVGDMKEGDIAFTIKKDQYKTDINLNNLSITDVDGVHLLLGDFSNKGEDINQTFKMLGLQYLIDLDGSQLNYNINSKIIFSPKEISAFKIIGNIGNSGNFSGSIASTRNEINYYNFDLTFNNLEFANLSMPLLEERVSTLINKSQDDNYLSYFRWFRTLSSSYRLKFIFNNSIIQNKTIEKITTNCKLFPGSMSLKIDLNSDFADGRYQIDVTANQLKPSLDLKINSINLNFDILKPLLMKFYTEDDQKNNTTLSSIHTDNVWSDKKLNIFKINKYTTNIDLSAVNLTFKSKNINNFRFIAHTKGDVLFIDNWYLKMYGGEFQSKGNISFFDKLLYQFSFSTSGMETKDIIKDIMPSLAGIEGPMAATGSIISQGNTMQSLVSRLNLSANFASPKITLNGIDSDSVVNLALRRKYVHKEKVLEMIDQNLNSGTTDLTRVEGNFKSSNGTISTNNLGFRTNLTNGVFAMSMDLNNLTLSSRTEFIFAPYSPYKENVDFSLIKTGSLKQGLNRSIDKPNLLKYVKWNYSIVTAEDIDAEKELAKKRLKYLSEDPDNKDYLYYKIQNQDNKDHNGNGDLKNDTVDSNKITKSTTTSVK